MSEHRKLATIMAVDVAGYSRAAEADEAKATEAVRQLRAAIEAAIAPHHGRVFSSAGDGFMIELPTASAGVEAASQLLVAPGAPPARIGLHLGEVMVAENGDLLGHGVNVAARLQQMAEPGSALVSQAVQAQIRSAQVKLAPLGKVRLDKMDERIDVFALAPDHRKMRSFRHVAWRRARRALAAVLALGVIGAGGYFGWRTLAAPAAATAPRLAVLRFEKFGDTEPFFAETLADELISSAGRVPGLEVIARASSFSLEGARATPRGAADELAATLVLTGTVQRIDDRVRVSAQLAEAPGGRQLWSRDFERPLSEIYQLQGEIATRVALAAGLRTTASSARRVDPQAYELYLRGREAYVADGETAGALLEQAVARDPQFAAAWAELARARLTQALVRWDATPPGTSLDPAWLSSSLEAADRAIALDPDDPAPYATKSNALRVIGRWTDALEAAELANERGSAPSAIYSTLGYTRRAIANARRGIERDPLGVVWWGGLSVACQAAGDLRCGIEAQERYVRLSETAPYELALLLHRAGRSAEALALTRQQPERWAELFRNPGVAPMSMTLLRAMLGEGAAPSPAELMATLDRGGHVENLVAIFAALDLGEDAAQLLPHWSEGARPVLFLLYDLRLAPMRASPQFWAIMEREGIAQLWRDSGVWPDFCERERSVCEQYLGS